MNDKLIELMDAIQSLSSINDQLDLPQELYVIEECSELVKELVKKYRGKNNHNEIVDEACDVLITVLTLLYRENVEPEEIIHRIKFKCKRAVQRFSEHLRFTEQKDKQII